MLQDAGIKNVIKQTLFPAAGNDGAGRSARENTAGGVSSVGGGAATIISGPGTALWHVRAAIARFYGRWRAGIGPLENAAGPI